MNRNQFILQAINEYLMEKFNYKTSPAYFGVTSHTIDARRKKVNLYFRLIEKDGGFWNRDTFVIARICFLKEKKGLGSDLLQFLSILVNNHNFKYIGIECTNEPSYQFAAKHGFSTYKGNNNYIIPVADLISNFQK